jgi:hypothetical protein
MDTPTPLLDRIERKWRTRPQPRKQPEWIKRMQEGKLPRKDLTRTDAA